MLRHYDEVGLFRPSHVDAQTGYRSYDPSQVERLQRIVIFRDLGFSIKQISRLLEEALTTEQLRGMLRLRRAELADELTQQRAVLDRIDTLLNTLEKDPTMPTSASLSISRRTVPSATVAACSATATDWGPDNIGPALQPLYPELFAALDKASVEPTGPGMAFYTERPDGLIGVFAAVEINPDDRGRVTGLDVIDLPEIDAVTTRHHGPMTTLPDSYAGLLSWISEHGLVTDGYSREVYLECPADQNDWVTELQFTVLPA